MLSNNNSNNLIIKSCLPIKINKVNNNSIILNLPENVQGNIQIQISINNPNLNKNNIDSIQTCARNPGFMEFQKLKKHVAESLNIPNSVQAAKIAGHVFKKIKNDNPEMDSVRVARKAIEEFDSNSIKYKKLI